MDMHKQGNKLHIAMFSVHGLIRGQALELGSDADTGGQTKYVVELAQALCRLPEVGRVDLYTRLIEDPAVSEDYAQPIEDLGNGARIVRVQAGPAKEYIRKEDLWDHLDAFADNALACIRESGELPDLIHSHYADAGYVGSRLSHLLGIPLVHTGHSLGRVKRRRLLAAGLKAEAIERQFNVSRRVAAEETTLASAEQVITSTHQEIEEQYGLYDHYRPEQMRVIPPGTDLERFHPPQGDEWGSLIGAELRRFLREPDKPIILALSRPDSRKNIGMLVSAYGESPQLQRMANLVIVAGNRDDIGDMEGETQDVLLDLLMLIDRYDLYGRVAYPKRHAPDDVPVLYRIAAVSRGVFVNPALTEPFGLTLIEAAASGLPIVATEDGGPRDIIGNCHNGLLIDPLDGEDIAQKLMAVLGDNEAWSRWAENGLQGVRAHYSWSAHARRYLETIRPIVESHEKTERPAPSEQPLHYHDRALFSDIDQTLLGDPQALPEYLQLIGRNRKRAAFGIATGRRFDSALKILRRNGIPEPDVLITSGGSEIHYMPGLTADSAWTRHIDHHWTPHVVRRVLGELPGLKLQAKSEQSRFKISYYIDPSKAPSLDEINARLHQEEQAVNAVLSFGQFLDILPIRASKGLALRYVADHWGLPLDHILVAGGSGADEDMMRGNTLAVVIANRHHEELSRLIDAERIYFAQQPYVRGLIEAIAHYDFFGACTAPKSEPEYQI